LVTGALTGKSGSDYGQVFISTVCTMSGNDQIFCGIRDDPPTRQTPTRDGTDPPRLGALLAFIKWRTIMPARDVFAGAIVAFSVVASIAGPTSAADLAKLPSLNARIEDSSISGISSGAFMAVQFGTAWSSRIKGVGVVTGGPFYCAQGNVFDLFNPLTSEATIALCRLGPVTDLKASFSKLEAKERSGNVDPLMNLQRQKIYIFHGRNDIVINQSVTDATADFYRHYLLNSGRGNLFYQTTIGAGHAFVVDESVPGLNACPATTSPYIDQCGYPQAGIILQHIYGRLNEPQGALTGALKSFEQKHYVLHPRTLDDLSMSDTGFVYIPKDCENGLACRVHIALHGCLQDAENIHQEFTLNAGYNKWADNNHVVILYPQTKRTASLDFLRAQLTLLGCWDWTGYVTHGDDYVTKSGEQIAAINAMLEALTAGAAPVPLVPPTPGVAPAGLAVIDVSDTGAALAWRPVQGAERYRVWRAEAGQAFALVGTVAGPSFGDSDLKPGSSYQWRVTAVVGGAEGPTSAAVPAATKTTPMHCLPGACPL
jgi:poly(3-hydroxybutyrate) depolymerase